MKLAKSPPPQLAALVFVALAVLFLMRGTLRDALSDPVIPDERAIAMVSVPAGSNASPIKLSGEWEGRGTLATPSGTDAAASLELPAGPWDSLTLRIGGDPRGKWRARVTDGFQRTQWFGLAAGARHELEGLVPDADSTAPIVLEILPSGNGADSALEMVDARVGNRALNVIPDAGAVLLIALIPFSLTMLLMGARDWTLVRAAPIGAISALVLAFLCEWKPSYLPQVSLFAVAIALGAVAGVLRRQQLGAGTQATEASARAARMIELAVPLALFAVAIAMRWDAFESMRQLPLRPDARGYVYIAREGSFYSTAQPWGPFVREPLFPAIIRVAYLILPSTESTARFVSLLISALVPPMIWLLGKRLVPAPAAIVAAGIIAAHRGFAELGVEALRNDAITLAFLGLALAREAFADRPMKRAAALGAIGAALVLLQLGLISLVVVVIAAEAFRKKWNWREIAIAALPTLLLLPSHLAFNRKISGDLMYSSNIHVNYYANREFAGQPGFPTREELSREFYTGGKMTVGGFLGHFTAPQIVTRLGRGLVESFATGMTRQVLFPGPIWWLIPGIIGGIWWLAQKRLWWFAAWNLVYIAPLALIAGGNLDWRITSTLAPLIVLVWCSGFVAAWEVAMRMRKKPVGDDVEPAQR